MNFIFYFVHAITILLLLIVVILGIKIRNLVGGKYFPYLFFGLSDSKKSVVFNKHSIENAFVDSDVMVNTDEVFKQIKGPGLGKYPFFLNTVHGLII